jgi:hypothetical protein
MHWQELWHWQARGYSLVIYVDLICCGVWRTGLPAEQEEYQCPQCSRPAKIVIIAEGVTRRPLPFEWQQVEKPLSAKIRGLIMTDRLLMDQPHVKLQRQPDRHRRKARAITAAAV